MAGRTEMCTAIVTEDHQHQGPLEKTEREWCGYCCSGLPMTDEQQAVTHQNCTGRLATGSTDLPAPWERVVHMRSQCGQTSSHRADASGDTHPVTSDSEAEYKTSGPSRCTSGDTHPAGEAGADDRQRGTASNQDQQPQKKRKVDCHTHTHCKTEADKRQPLKVTAPATLCVCSGCPYETEVGLFCFYCDPKHHPTAGYRCICPCQGCDPSENGWTTSDDEAGDGLAQANSCSGESVPPGTSPGHTRCIVCGIQDHYFKDRCFHCGDVFHEDTCGAQRITTERPSYIGDGVHQGTVYYCYRCGCKYDDDPK
jgi:hypothetical protein